MGVLGCSLILLGESHLSPARDCGVNPSQSSLKPSRLRELNYKQFREKIKNNNIESACQGL